MNADQTSGAGAYKADTVETVTAEREDRSFRPPFHLRLTKDRHLTLDYRNTAIAAGAMALGYAAFRGVSALISRAKAGSAVAAGHTARLAPVPLARSAEPAKDNAAPRFVSEAPNCVDEPAPFVAAADADDTGDLVVEVTEIDVVAITPLPGEQQAGAPDRSAETGEHVPTDLLGDAPPSPTERAPDAFRPDPTAPVPEGMRDSLRPATGTPPGFAAARGTFASGLSQTDGSK